MLDTNVCIYVINDRPSEVRRIFNERAEQLCISSVSLADRQLANRVPFR